MRERALADSNRHASTAPCHARARSPVGRRMRSPKRRRSVPPRGAESRGLRATAELPQPVCDPLAIGRPDSC
jgi:hypothetical protein